MDGVCARTKAAIIVSVNAVDTVSRSTTKRQETRRMIEYIHGIVVGVLLSAYVVGVVAKRKVKNHQEPTKDVTND